MFKRLGRWRTLRTLRRHPISARVWRELMRDAAIFEGLSAVERARLRRLTTLFLHRKTLTPVQGLLLTEPMAVALAAQACLLVLNLGLVYYRGWIEVVIYPDAFRVSRQSRDENGLISEQARVLQGEAWSRGPVILSWADVAEDLAESDAGHNVVVHEFAHKLDMINGRANGMPRLHGNMVRQAWTDALSDGFERLQRRLAHHHRTVIDPYGATTPAEFFSVVSEMFFTDAATLRHKYPEVYEQLALFYRQDPDRS